MGVDIYGGFAVTYHNNNRATAVHMHCLRAKQRFVYER